jgi:hypothetical protein
MEWIVTCAAYTSFAHHSNFPYAGTPALMLVGYCRGVRSKSICDHVSGVVHGSRTVRRTTISRVVQSRLFLGKLTVN